MLYIAHDVQAVCEVLYESSNAVENVLTTSVALIFPWKMKLFPYVKTISSHDLLYNLLFHHYLTVNFIAKHFAIRILQLLESRYHSLNLHITSQY